MKEIVNIKAKLEEEFSKKKLGSVKKIIKMRINRERMRLLKISQAEYVEKVLERFNMLVAKLVNIPLGSHFKLSKAHASTTKDEKALILEVLYA